MRHLWQLHWVKLWPYIIIGSCTIVFSLITLLWIRTDSIAKVDRILYFCRRGIDAAIAVLVVLEVTHIAMFPSLKEWWTAPNLDHVQKWLLPAFLIGYIALIMSLFGRFTLRPYLTRRIWHQLSLSRRAELDRAFSRSLRSDRLRLIRELLEQFDLYNEKLIAISILKKGGVYFPKKLA